MNGWKPDIVVYHHPCPDGFTSYWILHNHFGGDFISMPSNYGQPFDFEACRGKQVLFADFSLKKPELDKLVNEYGAEVVILDHHESAEKELADFTVPLNVRPEGFVGHSDSKGCAAWFDMDRSGASMTWDWCHPGMRRPAIVNFVEARDIWKPERMGEHQKLVMPISAYLRMHNKTISNWDELEPKLEFKLAEVAPVARSIWQYHMALVKEVASKAEWEEIGGHRVPSVNCIYELGSDVAGALLEQYPEAPFVAYYVVSTNKQTGKLTKFYGLRSEHHRENVSEIAAVLGGGGHRNASGFRQAIGE